MNNRLRYWLIMVWFVRSIAVTKEQSQNESGQSVVDLFASSAISFSISTSSPKYCSGDNWRNGPTLKKPLNKMRLEPPPFH